MNCAQHLVVSDLDGTLLGDDIALAQFALWCQQHRQNIGLVYATGRTFDSVAAMVRESDLPEPDAVIADVGTEIRMFPSGARLLTWPKIDASWDPIAVRQTLSMIPRLKQQPPEFQSEWKVSYYLSAASQAELNSIRSSLRQRQLNFEMIYSSNEYLDILPCETNKGTAVRELARLWAFDPNRVVVCGDTGNDLSMFQQGFQGVVVGNAHADLRHLCGPGIHMATSCFANGVLEGLNRWLVEAC